MGQPRQGGLGLEWQLVSLMEGDPVVGNAWDIHQVWVGGVWGQVGEVSRADEVRPVGYPESVGCEAVGHRDGFSMECGV